MTVGFAANAFTDAETVRRFVLRRAAEVVKESGKSDFLAFTSLEHARTVIAAWRRDYNQVRPHSALGNLTPAAFAATIRDQGFAKPTPSDKLANQDSTK